MTTVIDFNSLSPARQQYISKRAMKKGLTVEQFVTRNQPKPRVYPFTQIEDSQFAISKTLTDEAKHKVAEMLASYKAEYEQQGGRMTALTNQIIANPTDAVIGINGKDDEANMSATFDVMVGTHTVGFVQTGATLDLEGEIAGTFINDVYVKPEYRGWGVSTRIYQHCVQHLNTKSITISVDRVRGRCEYWSQWFDRWIVDPHHMLQRPNDKALISLTSELHQSPVQGLLTEHSLAQRIEGYFRQLKRLQKRAVVEKIAV